MASSKPSKSASSKAKSAAKPSPAKKTAPSKTAASSRSTSKPAAPAKAVKSAAKPAPAKVAKTPAKPARPAAKTAKVASSPQTPSKTAAAKTAAKAASKPEPKAQPKPAAAPAPKPAVPPPALDRRDSVISAAPVPKVASEPVPSTAAAPAAAAPGKIAKMTSASKEATATAPKTPAGKSSKPKSAPVIAGLLNEDQVRNAPMSDYMNDEQLVFFRERLLQMRNEVLARELEVKERLHQREIFADPADRASAEEEHWLDLRLRERESLLLRKIEDALRRIRDKEYGYCEKTGEPIGIARLLARPTATVCVDVKGQDERAESQYRDR